MLQAAGPTRSEFLESSCALVVIATLLLTASVLELLVLSADEETPGQSGFASAPRAWGVDVRRLWAMKEPKGGPCRRKVAPEYDDKRDQALALVRPREPGCCVHDGWSGRRAGPSTPRAQDKACCRRPGGWKRVRLTA